MDQVRLEEYSGALCDEFADDGDTLAVLVKLGRTKREEYEARIPCLGDLLDMVRCVGRDRKEKLRAAERAKAEAEERRHREEHPEEYVSVKDLVAEVNTLIKSRRRQAEEARA